MYQTMMELTDATVKKKTYRHTPLVSTSNLFAPRRTQTGRCTAQLWYRPSTPTFYVHARTDPLRVGEERVVDRVSRRRMGRAAARRPAVVRVPHPGRGTGGAELGD